ncbi:MAG: hypothetical protein MZV63_20315 [Marinilabiliales bacterium]|nr:hypothetical protein [Marinilabiliales bacterium]
MRAIFEDNNRYLWAATRDGRVYLFDPDHKMVGYLRENGTFRSGEALNATGICHSTGQQGEYLDGVKRHEVSSGLSHTGRTSPYSYRITGFQA